jgi:cytochrome c biogenesis protein ResB
MTTNRSAGWLRRQIAFLGSGRLAVMLLLAVSCLLYVHLVIPQHGQLEERVLAAWLERSGAFGQACQALGFTDILHSWYFWGVYGLLFLNLFVCMTRRLPVVVGRCRFPDRPPRPHASQPQRVVAVEELGAEDVAVVLRKQGYRTRVSGGTVHGLRGRFAAAGHWIFHAGLLALLVAGGWMAAQADPFRGTAAVGEGEPFDLHAVRLVSANRAIDPELRPLRFRLDRVDLVMETGDVRRFEASVIAPDGSPAVIAINRPFRSPPYQVLVHGFGYMPGWGIANGRGQELKGAWVKLAPFPLDEEDWFALGPADSGVTVRFDPNHGREGEADGTLSRELRNPRFHARVVWRGVEVYAGLLEPGEKVRLDGDREFFFLPEIRSYALLDVIEERGQAPIFGGLAIVIAGLLLRYARLRKEIVVQIGQRSLQIFGQGEIFEHLFEEDLDRLAGKLASAGPASGDRRGAA